VRDGLRKQDIVDIHDYLDIHRRLTPFAKRLQDTILAGKFRPREPYEVRLEKQLGITRRQLIPAPQDALVLQVLVEAMTDPLIGSQPTKRSYYSRTHMPKRETDVDHTFEYAWWKLWPQYQEKILEYARVFNVVVNTDIANYFDTVPLSRLRDQLSSIARFSAELLDFLFFVLEAYLWRGRYGPITGVGLPQFNFDACRLLAHVYLFPLDTFLEGETNGNFVRWMDDVNFGADSREHAKAILGRMQLVLNSLGLQVNGAKTKVLDAREAQYHFFAQENMKLTNLKNGRLIGVSTLATDRAHYLKKWFRRFNRMKERGNWEKVLKRYINEFGEYGDPYLQRYLRTWLADRPGLRDTIFRYLGRLGYTPQRLSIVLDFLQSGNCLDDASVFKAAKLVTEWSLPSRSPKTGLIVQVAENLAVGTGANSRFLAGLWLMAKYGEQAKLGAYVRRFAEVWMSSEFSARQVAAIAPLLAREDAEFVKRRVGESGLVAALEVFASLEDIANLQSLDVQLKSYLLSKDMQYPLPKVVVAVALLNSDSKLSTKSSLYAALIDRIVDPAYVRLLRRAYEV
jgi:hypothetical protein